MSLSGHAAALVQLGEVAEINPRLSRDLGQDADVSFVPLAALNAESGVATTAAARPYRDVAKGYTPFRDGDLLVAKITPSFENGKIGQARLDHKHGFGSTEFHVVRPGSRLHDRFALHFLRQQRVIDEGAAHMTGSAGQRRVPARFLSTLPIPLPPIAEQRRIAAILDKADDLRAKRRTAIATLDTLPESIFLDMFGDPLGPSRWRRRPLQSLVEMVVDCPHSTPVWSETGAICLRTPNLGRGLWDWTDERRVSTATYHERSRRAYLQPGDIVLSREGTLGVAAIVPEGMRACMGQRLVQVRCATQQLAPAYLLYVLLHVLNPVRIQHALVGSTAKHLNVSELKALQLAAPPIDLQLRFAASVEQTKRHRALQQASVAALDKAFAALQASAFSGSL